MTSTLLLIGVILLISVRALEFYKFVKEINKVCKAHDWKHVDENSSLVLEIIKKDYHLTNKWSALNFLFLQGPSPLSMFLSLKPLTLEKQYNEEILNKVKRYENR